jgi:arylsulfatase A-like enzyme
MKYGSEKVFGAGYNVLPIGKRVFRDPMIVGRAGKASIIFTASLAVKRINGLRRSTEITPPLRWRSPKAKEGHYTLNDALADEAIKYMFQEKSVTPDRPFFIYYAPGATHAPHHVPKEWIDKFKGQFDQGWDRYREETYQRQLKLGVIPPDTKLTPRPDEIPAWDSLSGDQKRVASRLMETFAA